MSRRWVASLAPLAICGWVLLAGAPLSAATRAEKQRQAEELVREALHHEIYGDAAARDRLLEQAAALAPHLDEVMWQRGYVQHQGKWVLAAELPQQLADDPRYTQYEQRRAAAADTVASQLELADWCAERGLADQERAHLMQVLSLDPEHAAARTRLGFRRVAGAWLSAEDVERTVAETDAARAALARWGALLREAARDLSADSVHRRKGAEERILEVRDPAAIPALEMALAGEGEAAATVLVKALAALPQKDAALALARQAVYSPWAPVRLAAATALRERPQDTFVPALLSTMYTPLVSRTLVTRGQDGAILYRHGFVREGQDQHEMLVLDTELHRVARAGGDGRETLTRAVAGAAATALERERAVALANLQTEALNLRVCEALGAVTEAKLPAQPDAWWDWWNQQNEIFVAGPKPIVAQQATQQVAVVDRVQDLAVSGGGGQIGAQGGGQRSDCLVAGTPVWTARGPIAVEKVQIGDLVLAQNPDTGELAYKPVLRTTVRPAGQLIAVRVGREVFETSGGHPFWVAGEGWVKARELESGMELHTLNGPALVSGVEPGSEAETYNLIVADFATFFIGETQLLSHDNTVRRATSAIVPGLSEE